MHEFGALMAAVSAASLGWRTSYLGPNLPVEDIAAAAFQRNAAAVAVSIVYPADDPHLPLELGKLARLLEGRAQLIVGGQGSTHHIELLKKIGATHVNNLTELRLALAEIRRDVETQQTG
jgi:methylmalonyl-CoA mutase cobalamin-binding subunit